ncbi:hypothetical protein KDW_23620 [Dictyobacter vulcani]|uniref:Protein-glutamine gamma-glutamyltransferase-like C-terminal domain-containing protein n=1 Tax=Dictyobacter vulcani TaxID=2607529 RepID=A0A5J4KP65_9CHLR|nr:hypothetical protein KDW_23620 [Dictyobacter vulcani]
MPIASALMEAQPIYLFLQLLFRRFTDSYNYLDVGSITLVLLGLHWWAIWDFYGRERRGEKWDYNAGLRVTWFDALAIVLALLILGLTHWYAIDNTYVIILMLILVVGGWKRSVDRARSAFNEEQLILAFKIGLGVLMAVLVLSLFQDQEAGYSVLDDVLNHLPIFFLSGFIALSFTRVGAARKEQARHGQSYAGEGSNKWVKALTSIWLLLIVMSIAFEVVPGDVLLLLLSPFWWLFGLLASALLFVINIVVYAIAVILNWLLTQLTHLVGKPVIPLIPTHMPDRSKLLPPLDRQHHIPPIITLSLDLLVIAIVVALLLALIFFMRKRRVAAVEKTLADEDEIREGLDVQQIRQERRLERRQRRIDTTESEALATASVRVRYRAFLQAMAEQGSAFEHRKQETPLEYQKRLLALAQAKLPAEASGQPSDPAILAELTQAYNQERYGAKETASERLNYLKQWVPHLLQRLKTHLVNTSAPTQKHPYQPSRWGED